MDSIMKEFEHLVVKLEDVKSATDNFNDTNIIGRGGFGKVYQGELSQSRGKTKAAFKRLDRKHGQGDPQFWKEIMMLSRYTHDNLISLLGFCNEGDEKILVYALASNGGLDGHLSSTTLTWTQRIRICHDAAKGLCYLHEDKGNHHRVLHRDIKSSNILLDKNWEAKVSDLGLAKVGPANQFTFLITDNVVGTLGYIDPMYLRMGFLTKESDVYSFGVVLFEVLCGRLCFDNSNARSGNIVHIWKQRYKENKLDEIMFKDDLVQALDPSSLEIFSEIAFQCLQESREKRPKMTHVVEKLEIALKSQELVDFIQKEYQEILKAVAPPLIYRSLEELKVLLSKGVLLNGGQTWLSINEKMEHTERIYIEGCINLAVIKANSLQHPSDFDIVNSRFPGGRCYEYLNEFKARVRGQYLTPQISYTVNLVFRYRWNTYVNSYNPLRYKVDGEDETKVFIIYPIIHEREDGWFIVPFYQFTSQDKTADLLFVFEPRWISLLVAGIEFQPSEEKVELQVIEEYQDMVKDASQSLFYTSLDELKQILYQGVHLNGYKTWFSLNEKGRHCHMISMEDCLIPNDDFTFPFQSHSASRFPAGFYQTNNKGFKTHVKTQFLSPSITYTVNLVFYAITFSNQHYVDLKYRLRGETTTSTVYLANRKGNDFLLMAELYQFTSDGSIVELEITFDNHGSYLQVEGILFQPLEKVEDPMLESQVFPVPPPLEDDKVEDTQPISDSRMHLFIDAKKFTTKMNLLSIGKWFQFNHDTAQDDTPQEWSYLDKNEKKCLMLSARGSCLRTEGQSTWRSLAESRFREVLVITGSNNFEINSESYHVNDLPETNYAIYLVYKLPRDQSTFEAPMFVWEKYGFRNNGWYIYLVSPPHNPVIGPNFDENSYSPQNKPKLNAVPRQRTDGWMEVKVCGFTKSVSPMYLQFEHPSAKDLYGLIIQGIDIRPI